MKNIIRFSLMIFSLAQLVSCTHAVHMVETQGVQPGVYAKGAERISSESQQFTIMGVVTETNYVNEAHRQLIAKCPTGNIGGVATRFSTSHGFFSWTNKVKISGWCYTH